MSFLYQILNLQKKSYFKGSVVVRNFDIFFGQFIQQMSRDMINLIISGGEGPLFLL